MPEGLCPCLRLSRQAGQQHSPDGGEIPRLARVISDKAAGSGAPRSLRRHPKRPERAVDATSRPRAALPVSPARVAR